MNVSVQTKKEGKGLQIYIAGEIDTFTATKLREELEAIEIADELEVILDLSNIQYIDSTGLGILVAFYKKTVKLNVHLKLVGLSKRLERLFEITGLSELMDVKSDKKVRLSHGEI